MTVKAKASIKPKAAIKPKVAVKPNKKISSKQKESQKEAALEDLRESEGRYRTILDEMEDAYFEIDLAGNFIFVNDTMCRILGYSREELIGMNFRVQMVKEDIEPVYNIFGNIYRTGKPERGFFYKFMNKDGAIRFADTTAFPLQNQQGEIVGFRGIGRDITERRQAEERLRESEQYFKEITDNSSDIVVITDKDAGIKYCSLSIERFTGYKLEELIGSSVLQYIHKDDLSRAIAAFGEAIQTKDTAIPNEFRIVHKDGSERYFDGLGKNLLDNPSIAGFIMNIHDITERRQAEEALRQSEERYRTFVENASDIVFQTDATGHFNFINPSALRITGYREEDFMGKHYTMLIHPDMLDEAVNLFATQWKNRVKNTYYEFLIITKDGQEKWIGQNTQLLFEIGKPSGFQAVARDITESKRLEEMLRQSEEKYRTIIENIQDGYFEVDLAGNFTFFNESMRETHGYPKEELMGMNNRQYTDKENAKKVFEAFNEIYKTGITGSIFEYEIIRKNGAKRQVEVSASLKKDSLDNPIGFRGIARDITERKRSEEMLRQSEERYRTLVENASDIVFRTDISGHFTFVNPVTLRITGYSEEEIIGKHYKMLIRPDMFKEVIKLLASQLENRVQNTYHEFPVITKNGQEIWLGQNTQLLLEDGQPSGFQAVARNITESKLAEEKIQHMATHDSLTGLPNRMMFTQLLSHALQAAKRYQKQCAVLFMDLDRFKIINDTLGHDAGDLLLQEIAVRLKQTLRSADVIARLGGDEFVILIEEVNDSNQIATVAHKIITNIIKPITIMGQECRITASIGISVFPKDAEDERSLMKNADIAMYLAKEEGKNNYQFYSEDIQSKSLERLSIESHLRHALECNEFFLHYQAKLDFKTNVITGVEALLRWNNPALGSVTPTQFIPVAEEISLIVPIGRWVLRTACAQNVAWQKQGLPLVCMAVNLSLRQLTDDNLIDDIKTALTDSGMAPNLLELEITESMVMHNPARMANVLAKIKTLGVRLAIDDFGTGYSSLAQIKHFPIDTLKVDRSFIRNVPQDIEDKAITEAIIAMGRTLSLTVVAEGVETQEQMDFLREHSCDEMQGYYFSKPIAPEQFAELLRGHDPSLQK